MKIRLNTKDNFPYQESMHLLKIISPRISLFRFDKI